MLAVQLHPPPPGLPRRPGPDMEIITWLDDHFRYALHVSCHPAITAIIARESLSVRTDSARSATSHCESPAASNRIRLGKTSSTPPPGISFVN